MISSWLTNFLGTLGTAALLLVVGISYLIWQFNPTINLPQRNLAQETDEMEEPEGQELQAPAIKASAATTIHDLYTEAAGGAAEKGNILKGESGMIITENGNLEEAGNGFGITEKEVPDENELTIHEPMLDKEIVDDILHTHDLPVQTEETNAEPVPKKTEKKEPESDLQLEIKSVEEKEEEAATEKDYSDLPPYEPTLDLRDYKYPKIDLLEAHGSEKNRAGPG